MMAVTFYMFKLVVSRFATNKHDLKGWFSFSVVTHYRTGRSPPRASNTGYNLANITVMSSHQSCGWICWIWISDHTDLPGFHLWRVNNRKKQRFDTIPCVLKIKDIDPEARVTVKQPLYLATLVKVKRHLNWIFG